jgi:hypothetical protein
MGKDRMLRPSWNMHLGGNLIVPRYRHSRPDHYPTYLNDTYSPIKF